MKQYLSALDFLNQAVALQSWSPALLEKAKVLVHLGDWEQAAETLQRVLQQNEGSMEGLRLNVLMHMVQQADDQVTQELLRRMIKSMEIYEGLNADLFYKTARTLSRLAGRKPQIMNLISGICKKAIQLNPSSTSIYIMELAYEKAMLCDYDSAMKSYREAGRTDETNIAALYGTIYSHIMLGELSNAEQQLDFLVAISESIEPSAHLPFLKALLAWRHLGDADKHANLLEQAEILHFKSMASYKASDTYEKLFLLNPDFLIQLAKEYILHLQFAVKLMHAGKARAVGQSRAVRRGMDILEHVSREAPGLVEPYLILAHTQFTLGEFEAATRVVNIALNFDTRSAPVHLLAAQLALANGNTRGAGGALDQATACDFHVRKAPAYALVKAELYLLEEDPEGALKILRDAIQLPGIRDIVTTQGVVPVSERVAVFVNLANVLSGLNRFAEAASILAEARVRFAGTSDEARVLMSSSMLAIKCNDFDKAISILDGVPKSSPVYVCVQHFKANLYLTERHDKHTYMQCFRDLVDFSPSAHSYEQLAAAFMHIQALEAAIEAYEHAYSLSPHDVSLAVKIGHALVSTHDYLKATNYYVTALQAHADDISLRHDLATLFMKLKKHGNATKVLTYVLQPAGSLPETSKMSNEIQSLLLLAEVHARAAKGVAIADVPDAKHAVVSFLLKARDLQRLILKNVNSIMETPEVVNEQKRVMVKICCELANCYLEEDKPGDKALDAYQDALKADNANNNCMFQLARLWAKQNKQEKSEQQCVAILRINPKHDDSAMLLADLLSQNQNHEAATDRICQILERHPSNYLALSKLIRLFRRAGRLDDVSRFLEIAEQSDSRALSHPGLCFCKGLNCRYSNNLIAAIKHFNLARWDSKWGGLAIMNMIELYLNPENEPQNLHRVPTHRFGNLCNCRTRRWDEKSETEFNLQTDMTVGHLLKELEIFEVPVDVNIKVKVLRAYSYLTIRSQAKIDQAIQMFIEILERRKDYLPALLGISTAFLIDKSTTKARNALKRIAKMPYSHELAEEFERGYLLLAEIYIQKSKFDLSEDLCNRCLKYNLSCSKAWETMGVIREREASYKDAADMYEKAWRLEHRASASTGFKLAFNYLKAKRFVEAIEVCNKVLNLYPDYPQIRADILDKAMIALRP